MEFNATFLVSAVSFILFCFIMNAIFYKPLQKVVLEREKFIDETNKEADENYEKSEALIKDKNDKIEAAKLDSKKVILDKTEEMKSKKAQMTEEARTSATSMINTAKTDMNKEKEDSQAVLDEESKKLADEIVSKILG